MAIATLWNIEKIKDELQTHRLGHPLVFIEKTGSTNSVALELIKDGAANGTLVLAEEQTAGRGRRNRAWSSARGMGIWMSLVFKTLENDQRNVLCNMICALSVVETIKHFTRLDPLVKWPNDVWIDNKKVCGVLIEAAPARRMIVAGLGINMYQKHGDFPGELACTATSLFQAARQRIAREEFLLYLLATLEQYYAVAGSDQQEAIVNQYRAVSLLINKDVTVNKNIRGKVIDIDRNGALVVKTKAGKTEMLYEGDIEFDI
jgi:BirA family transcriptional regulator, biotin operon repressor / biotin---[acetyl-CoA-carboxylase] ligase